VLAEGHSAVKHTVGDLVAHFLSQIDVDSGFGIISVHNIPILDAIGRLGRTRFVMTRGEAGAAHMADAYARVTGGLGLLITSTGPGAANAVCGLAEARFSSSPVLHITGQVPLPLIDCDTGTTHDMPHQLDMLRSVCKSAYRIGSAGEAWEVLTRAAVDALSAPRGPVSVEIPIDVQKKPAALPSPGDEWQLQLSAPVVPPNATLDLLAKRVLRARRPMLWVGSGARRADTAVKRLLDLGFGMTSSWAGRGIVPEDHPMSLGALNGAGVSTVRKFYESVDLMVIAGSRLRGQETIDWTLPLPSSRVQIDIDAKANGRTYSVDQFIEGDCLPVLEGLLERIEGRMRVEPGYREKFAAMKSAARSEFAATLGPYGDFANQLRRVMPRDALWVRDITIANSTWGNRLFELYGPRDGIHPVGAGIGQGLPLGVGAAVAAGNRKTVVLSGDAGFMMNVSELWTAVQEKLDITFIVMNDSGYGVIRHMQDAAFGGRRMYGDLVPPDFSLIAQAASAHYEKVDDPREFGEKAGRAIGRKGIALVEVDMRRIGEAPAYFPYASMKN